MPSSVWSASKFCTARAAPARELRARLRAQRFPPGFELGRRETRDVQAARFVEVFPAVVDVAGQGGVLGVDEQGLNRFCASACFRLGGGPSLTVGRMAEEHYLAP